MICKNKKTTVSTTTVTWSTALTDDTGSQFATMSAEVDRARPFGTFTMTVHLPSVFEKNKEQAKAAYAEFKASFAELVDTIEPSSTIIEETEDIIEDTAGV